MLKSVAIAEPDDDGFETLPSKILAASDRDEIFRKESFKCPVCGLTGGPTFLGGGKSRVSVIAHGLRIPSDHCPECLEKVDAAHFYLRGLLDDAQMGSFVHTADSECTHPLCLGKRLWGQS